MIEFNINEGNQKVFVEGFVVFKKGVFIIDVCINWENIVVVFEDFVVVVCECCKVNVGKEVVVEVKIILLEEDQDFIFDWMGNILYFWEFLF